MTVHDIEVESQPVASHDQLCSRCKDPLSLWSLDTPRDDEINFVQPPAASPPSPQSTAVSDTSERIESGLPEAEPDTQISLPDIGECAHKPAEQDDANINEDTKTHCISPISDLLITLQDGHTLHRYLVSSQILRVVSPVWRKQLDPDSPFHTPWRERTEEINGRTHQVMQLAGDDDDDDVADGPDTLLAVLHVLHFSPDGVPASIDFAQLRAFAVLCDKYDCVHVLRMWSRSWLDQWVSVVLEPGYEDWLFVAKVFGDERSVKELEDRLVEESSSLSVCGSYFLRKGVEVSTALIPEAVLNRIMSARAREITRQINIWRHFLQTFVADNVSKGCPNWDCVTLSYGNMIRSVEQSGLVRVFNRLEDWHGNLLDFEERTGAIHLANGTRFHGYGWCPVENLNVALRGELERRTGTEDD
ncbi:hypothetical protein DRE_06613 [Drechslerella stenobrocha 248]|uniref:BTB domain-containing protein n=1 Tax=Drechslerella stenobrocha 248 TaxID=1043628 RepID=W7HNB7_9PEZI|nr:hypothetical protein DRE_06613 [Drechslerella stenobrocha 248]